MQDVPTVSELMLAMNFEYDDIEANRKGTLSERQKARLDHARKRNLLIGAVIFILLVILATVLLFLAQINQSFALSIFGALIIICNAIVIGFLARSWMRLTHDMRSGEIDRISGELERVIRPQGRANNYLLRVNGTNFYVNKDVFKMFRHEIPYHMYRTHRSRVLLSAEPISVNNQNPD